MPTVTLPTFTNGDPLVGSDVFAAFVNPVTPEESLSVVNGELWTDNIASGTKIAAEHTQRGSAVRGKQVAGTANLDWRWTWFGDWSSPAATDFAVPATLPYQFIPGGCIEFYVPWDTADVLLLWQCHWFNDHYTEATARSDIFLMTSDQGSLLWRAAQRRAVAWGGNGSDDPTAYRTARCWSGHDTIEFSKGWHRAGLALVASSRIRNTRTWAVNMAALLMKQT